MDAKVVWNSGLSFTGTADSGFEVSLGAAREMGGDDDGFRPLEMLLIGLAGCTGMDVISILEKKKQKIASFEVRVHADRANEHPRVFTHLFVEYVILGHDLDTGAAEHAVELSLSKYCSAHAMLEEAVRIETKITLAECADLLPTNANPLGVPLRSASAASF